ncbi:hypothetical protein LCGC14_2741550 [marine sediment metagenome]|uniref:Glutamyl-tRNA reductase N-terminal domain-containing protein n=1 Tax=marine sediment metagenome TaxID=412755 RepID=A0A0F8Z4B7_9ZZZZ
MNIIVAGLNHKSAPIDIRERLAFDAADTIKALRELKSKFPDTEFVLLSTCNRVELYSASPSSAAGMGGLDGKELAKFLSEFHSFALEDFQEFLYVHSLSTGLGSNDIGLDRGQLGDGVLWYSA